MRNVYAVTLRTQNSEVEERITENFPGASSYRFTDQFFLVRGDLSDLVSDIARKVGLKGKKRIQGASGAVFKLNQGYSGFTKPDLWDWLSNLEDE